MPNMHVLNTLLPVFLIIALGALLRKIHLLPPEFVEKLNRLIYWIALPCLLFYKIAAASYDYSIAGKTFLVVMTAMLTCILIAYVIAFFLRVPAPTVGTFVQGAYRGNLVYIALPVIIYSFSGSTAFDSAAMETLAVLVIALTVPVYNTAAIVVLLASRHKIDRHVPAKILRQIMTNPLFLACVAGIIYSALFPRLPVVISRSCNALGQIALPLALLGIGATLVIKRISAPLKFVFTASVIKIALAPIAGLLTAKLLALGPGETRIALLFLAAPTAVVSYVMADQLDGDTELSAAIVVVSCLLSILSLSVVVGLF
jgi:predicted permease